MISFGIRRRRRRRRRKAIEGKKRDQNIEQNSEKADRMWKSEEK